MSKHIKYLFLLSSIMLICLILFAITKKGFKAPVTPKLTVETESEVLSETKILSDIETSPETEISSETNTSSDSETLNESETFTNIPGDLVLYKENFFYHSLTDSIKERITGISYPATESAVATLSVDAVNVINDSQTPAISYDALCYMNILYYDFNGEIKTGELICNKKIANDLVEIFYELYLNEYPIEKICLIDEYNGDDTASMLDNNTSCFNYRVVDGTSNLSKHAIGCAIDINPFYNPYIVFNKDNTGETYISPKGSEIYADRSQSFPYKIDENDLCYKLFKEHGFVWGGDWNSCKDYQHFQKVVK